MSAKNRAHRAIFLNIFTVGAGEEEAVSLKTLTMDRLDPSQYMAGLYDRQEPLGADLFL